MARKEKDYLHPITLSDGNYYQIVSVKLAGTVKKYSEVFIIKSTNRFT